MRLLTNLHVCLQFSDVFWVHHVGRMKIEKIDLE